MYLLSSSYITEPCPRNTRFLWNTGSIVSLTNYPHTTWIVYVRPDTFTNAPVSPLKLPYYFYSRSAIWLPLHLGSGYVPPFFFIVFLGGVRLSPLGTSATLGLLYQPRMIDGGDFGAVSGIRIGRGNRSTRRKPAPVPLCPPQIPHDLTWMSSPYFVLPFTFRLKNIFLGH
jgi:hypothetical protein